MQNLIHNEAQEEVAAAEEVLTDGDNHVSDYMQCERIK